MDLHRASLPSALPDLAGLRTRGQRTPVLLADFDGTLAPIVAHEDEARMPEATRAALARVARRCPTAVLSGRDLASLRPRIALAGVHLAGNHGFEIEPAGGARFEPEEARPALPALARVREALARAQLPIGVRLEHKRWSVAVHHRELPGRDLPALQARIEELLAREPLLRLHRARSVLELQPDIPWHKGEAARWLLRHLGLHPGTTWVVHLGDDLTDEDVFRSIAPHGAGVLVGRREGDTAARYGLLDPGEVRAFLERLATYLEESSA